MGDLPKVVKRNEREICFITYSNMIAFEVRK